MPPDVPPHLIATVSPSASLAIKRKLTGLGHSSSLEQFHQTISTLSQTLKEVENRTRAGRILLEANVDMVDVSLALGLAALPGGVLWMVGKGLGKLEELLDDRMLAAADTQSLALADRALAHLNQQIGDSNLAGLLQTDDAVQAALLDNSSLREALAIHELPDSVQSSILELVLRSVLSNGDARTLQDRVEAGRAMTPEQLHACASKMTDLLGVLEGSRTATLQHVEKLANAFGSTSSAPDGHGAALDELEGLSWSELSTELGHVGQIAGALGNLGVIPDDVSTMLTQAATVGQLGIAWISATTPLGAAAAGAGLVSVLAGFFANRGDGIDAAHSLLRTQQQILQLQQETLKAVQQLAQHVRKLEDSIEQLRVDVARVNYGVWQARADLTVLLRDEIDTLADFVASLEEASLGELEPSLETLTRHYEQHGDQFRVGIHGLERLLDVGDVVHRMLSLERLSDDPQVSSFVERHYRPARRMANGAGSYEKTQVLAAVPITPLQMMTKFVYPSDGDVALQTDPWTTIDTSPPLTTELVNFAATFGPWPMDALAVLETATMAVKVHGHFDLMRDSSFVHLRTRAELASSAGSGLRGRRLIVRALHHVNRAIFEAIAMSGQPWVPDIAGLFLFGNPFARENFEAARLHMHGIHSPRLPQLLMENVGRAMVAWLLSRPGTDADAYRAARAAVLQGSSEGHAALEQALALHDVPTHGFKSLTVIGEPRYCFLTTDEGFVLQKVSKGVHGYHLSGVRYLAPYPEDWSTFEYPGPIEELARLRRTLESALFDYDAPASMTAEERQLLASLL